MDVSVTPLVERIARVLAAQRISANGAGQEESAGKLIDANWPDYRDDALAVLHTLREPTAAMATPATWRCGSGWCWWRSTRRCRTVRDGLGPGPCPIGACTF